jgi:pilus assembly protein CpaD
MVANPADLLGPRTMTPRDSTRRDVAYGKYINGEQTGASSEAVTIQKVNN